MAAKSAAALARDSPAPHLMQIDFDLTPADLLPAMKRMWSLSAEKIRRLDAQYDPAGGSPVYTVQGVYTARGWTEWTQGFQFGSAILQFDATGDPEFLEIGRQRTLDLMAPHVSHVGVHDHGFNNVSTYGNLLRMMEEGGIEDNPWERNVYQLALKCSGAVQAARWTKIRDGGFIYSFNGPHSLFVDTIRSLRALAVAHNLGHVLMGENDRPISLLERLIEHGLATARYSVYFGESRDAFDVRGRTAHESVFNTNDGHYRCPSTQQGYSPFSTWTRGLAWAISGFAEQLEYLATIDNHDFNPFGGRPSIEGMFRNAASATADFYIDHTTTDGIPFWDTGAPELHRLGDYRSHQSDPYNDVEPVDSSAAAIASQGLLRLGRYLQDAGATDEGARYWQAGLTVLRTLLAEPYLSVSTRHQGLLLHSVYHRPNGWDYVPPERDIPCGESSMWGDYHLRDVALYAGRVANGENYLRFWR